MYESVDAVNLFSRMILDDRGKSQNRFLYPKAEARWLERIDGFHRAGVDKILSLNENISFPLKKTI